MSPTQPFVLPPDRETPAFYQQAGRFYYRVAYSRSTDSRNSNETGQDYLTLRVENDRFAFALCDGVSQSFYGDLAARILGDKLLEWVWTWNFGLPLDQLRENLHLELNNLTEAASLLVRDHPVPDHVAPMVRAVLDKKRALGSEATFIAGIIDIPSNAAGLAWMGDSRLHLWRGDQELLDPFQDTFKTSERWSTLKGPVGTPHLAQVPRSDFDHLAAYSDGFAYLDAAYQVAGASRPFSNHAIDEFIADAARRPSSDDISFLEFWITPTPPQFPKVGESLVASPPKYEHRNEGHFFSWKPVSGATSYEIKLSDENETTLSTSKVDKNEWQSQGALDANARFVAVRAWSQNEPGSWSAFQPLNFTAPMPQRSVDVSPVLPLRPNSPLPTQLPGNEPFQAPGAPRPSEPVQVSPNISSHPPLDNSLRPTPVVHPPGFSTPPETTEYHRPVSAPPVAGVPTRAVAPGNPQQRPPATSGWIWGILTIVVLLCLGGVAIGMIPGVARRFAVAVGASKIETPTATLRLTRTTEPTDTPFPTPSPSETTSRIIAVIDDLSPTVTETVTPTATPITTEIITPTLTGTPTALPTDTPSAPTVTPPPDVFVTTEAQAAVIKKAFQLRQWPNGQYVPATDAPVYKSGEKVFLLKKYSDVGVDWYQVRASDGAEGWVMGKMLDLEGIHMDDIFVVDKIVFPTMTPGKNP